MKIKNWSKQKSRKKNYWRKTLTKHLNLSSLNKNKKY